MHSESPTGWRNEFPSFYPYLSQNPWGFSEQSLRNAAPPQPLQNSLARQRSDRQGSQVSFYDIYGTFDELSPRVPLSAALSFCPFHLPLGEVTASPPASVWKGPHLPGALRYHPPPTAPGHVGPRQQAAWEISRASWTLLLDKLLISTPSLALNFNIKPKLKHMKLLF